MPFVSNASNPSVPSTWWQKVETKHFLGHNILVEPKDYDPSFDTQALANDQMRKRYLSLTNGDRRHAVVSCLVAARQFLEHELKPPARHACYAMFGQQCCRPLRV